MFSNYWWYSSLDINDWHRLFYGILECLEEGKKIELEKQEILTWINPTVTTNGFWKWDFPKIKTMYSGGYSRLYIKLKMMIGEIEE
jgi:hypothetical protein